MWRAIWILIVFFYFLIRWLTSLCVRFIPWICYLSVLSCALLIAFLFFSLPQYLDINLPTWASFFYKGFSLGVIAIGLSPLRHLWKYVVAIECFLGEYFAVNPEKFESLQYLNKILNPPSYSYKPSSVALNTSELEPEPIQLEEPETSSIDELMNRITEIAESPKV